MVRSKTAESWWYGKWVADCFYCQARFGSPSKDGAIGFRKAHIARRHLGRYLNSDSEAVGKVKADGREVRYHNYPENGD